MTRPGRLISATVDGVGAILKPAEISQRLVWISLVDWTGRGLAPALAQAARKGS